MVWTEILNEILQYETKFPETTVMKLFTDQSEFCDLPQGQKVNIHRGRGMACRGGIVTSKKQQYHIWL